MHVTILQLCKTTSAGCLAVETSDGDDIMANRKRGLGLCSKNNAVWIHVCLGGAEGGGCAHKQKTGPLLSTPRSLVQCWHDYTSLCKDADAVFFFCFFMTIICCACVCPAAGGIKIKCCNTSKRRQSKQKKKKDGGKEKNTTTTDNNNNNSEMPTPDSLYNSALASAIRDPDPLFGRQNG